ncbi:unnamed protein product [marine sediment metagenome]|uniref:Bacteriophage lambda Replication protein O N-terminal domain-containing protein n=1 Tax=marine sediment metagenome TaxID=412755 RepID=X0XK04_9ZZZZ
MDNYDQLSEQGTDQQFYDKTYPSNRFDIVPHELASDASINDHEYRLLVVIAGMYNHKNQLPCWAGNEYIAKITGRKVKTVQNMITTLKKKDKLRVEHSSTRRYLIVTAMESIPKFNFI